MGPALDAVDAGPVSIGDEGEAGADEPGPAVLDETGHTVVPIAMVEVTT